MKENDINRIITEVWDGFGDEEWRKDQSHYRGVGRWTDDRRWQRIGAESLNKIRYLYNALKLPHFPEPINFLEWGPGGGANLFAFRYLAKKYYGIDISQKNLDEASRMIAAEGKEEIFCPVLLDGPPSSILNIIPDRIDIFLSTACFQHFPSKEYGAAVLRAIHGICQPKAVGFIQIRFDNGDQRFCPIESIDRYQEKAITANSYGLDEFWRLVLDCGFRPHFIRELNVSVNYATFYLSVQ